MNHFKKAKANKWFFLILIIIIALFFRLYKLEDFFIFEHDQDLYSFIVKDILSGHLRLIGQLTSIDGVFIGPLYYYLLAPFYLISRYNPLSAYFTSTIISLLCLLSIYYIFYKLFSHRAGLIGAFLYACSLPLAFFDRWIVPTQTTLLWSVWFLYALFLTLNRQKKGLPIFGILAGLVWHIHIALLPLLLLIPISVKLSKIRYEKREILIAIAFSAFLTLPFWMFELRHGFQQMSAMINSVSQNRNGIRGFERLFLAIDGGALGLVKFVYYKWKAPAALIYFIFASLALFLATKHLLSKNQIKILAFWIVLIICTQFLSRHAISDYYFNNLVILSLAIISLFLAEITKKDKSKILIITSLLLFAFYNLSLLLKESFSDRYLEKKKLVQDIKEDASRRNFQCVGINYVADLGTGVGFRYLLWYFGLKTVKPAKNIPVYNIYIPYYRYFASSTIKYGLFALEHPNSQNFDFSICNNPSYQELPLLGYTS